MTSNITAVNSNAYIIPLTPGENQEFDIPLNGVTYHLKFRWSNAQQCWSMDIEDSQRNLILPGVPLITGCDLLEQFDYLGLKGAFVVQSTNNPDLVPSFSTLGDTGNLFFIVPA